MIVNHKEVARSKRLEQCSLAAYNAYAHLIGWHDDWARGEWNERRIVAQLWPRKRAMLPGQVQKFLREYLHFGLIRRYVVEDVEYFEWQSPEFPAIAPSRRRRQWMRCPPPPWAPKDEHDVWAALRGAGKPVDSDTLVLPFDEVAPTSPRPSKVARETGHQLAAELPAVSVPSVPAVPAGTTTAPPPPLLAQGGAGPELVAAPAVSRDQVIGRQVDLAEAYFLRLGGKSSRRIRRQLRNNLRDGWTFAEECDRLVNLARQQLQDRGLWDWNTPAEAWPPRFDEKAVAHSPPAAEVPTPVPQGNAVGSRGGEQ